MIRRADMNQPVWSLYDDTYFTGGGAGYTDYISGRWALRARAERYAAVVRRAGLSPGAALEIGSAAGFTLAAFRDAGWIVNGIEPNQTMARFARTELSIPTRTGAVEDLELLGPYDLVLILQVLEHVRDPLMLLRRVRDSLRPGGVALVETWSLYSWAARLLGTAWHQYSPPTVLHWFSARGLTRLMNASGLHLVRTGRPLKLITLQNGLSLLRAKYPVLNTPLTQRIGDSRFGRLAVPYPPIDLFWALYRRED